MDLKEKVSHKLNPEQPEAASIKLLYIKIIGYGQHKPHHQSLYFEN